MHLTGTSEAIITAIEQQQPDIRALLAQARALVTPSTRAIAEYQAAALYALARPYNRPGARVLEIGTAQGYSAAVLALAMPDAHIVTLNPHPEEAALARHNLAPFGERVDVLELKSWDFLDLYDDPPFDFIFCDGDHKNVRRDFPWRTRLTVGGLMLFHDFSPNGTYRACPPVYRALQELRGTLGRDFDALIVDDGGVGMAGFIRRIEDDMDTATSDALAITLSYSSASWSYLTGLYALAQQVKDIPGALVECGCQNGGSAAALALGLGVERKTYLFDTFAGVPKPEPEDGDKAMSRWETSQPNGWALGSAKSARECLKAIGVKGAKLVTGDFADTLPKADTGPIAVLHIDSTLYRSTKTALERLYPDVVEGGLIIVSAYHHWPGVKLAVMEYFRAEMPTLKTLEKGAWWFK